MVVFQPVVVFVIQEVLSSSTKDTQFLIVETDCFGTFEEDEERGDDYEEGGTTNGGSDDD